MKAILFPLFFLSVLAISCSISNSKKTTKLTFNGGELLYTDSITETQANDLGNYLVKTGFFDGKEKTVQLSKENGIIHFAMILNDSLINSEAYQNAGVAYVSELEQNVFKGSTVEVDYCDAYMKVKKNMKGDARSTVNTVTNTTEATNVSDTDAADNTQFIAGYWLCTNMTGGDVDATTQAHDLEILQGNFSFDISEDGTFTSNFINQNDLENPIPITGNYAMSNGQIGFSDLQINGQANPNQKMSFQLNMPTGDELQLSSQTPGKAALVMSFQRQQ